MVEAARTARQSPLLAVASICALATLLVACDHGPALDAPPPRLVESVVSARSPNPGALPPLLVLLHGLGSNERDLAGLGSQLDPRLTVVSVRAPRPYRSGFAWFGIDWRLDGSLVPKTTQARETLTDFVRWLGAAPARLGTDPRRTYLLGFSQGAMMSLGVLRTAPERVAGIVALSGKFDDDLFGAARASSDAMAGVALFVAHGTNDDLLPVSDGRAIRDIFEPLIRDFTYREYPIPHAIGPGEIGDVAAWLRERLDRGQWSARPPSRK